MNFDKSHNQMQEYGKYAPFPYLPYMFNPPRSVDNFRLNVVIEDADANVLVLASPDVSISELKRKPREINRSQASGGAQGQRAGPRERARCRHEDKQEGLHAALRVQGQRRVARRRGD